MTFEWTCEEDVLGGLLLKTDDKADRKLLEMLAETTVSVRTQPRTGLVMMSVTDATGEDFHLGEVLVTEAEAEFEGHAGYAAILGNQPGKALIRAALSAILESDNIARKTAFCEFLAREAEKIRETENQAEALVASTTVHFEKMTQW